MKSTKLKKLILLTGISYSTFLHAQWNFLGTNWVHNTAPIRAIGVGNFPTSGDIQARLHVNNFYLNQPNGSYNGNLFRTDGRATAINQWQIFTGTTAANATEKFRLWVPSNSDNAVFTTVQNGNFLWETNALNRMTLYGSNNNNGGSGDGALVINHDPGQPAIPNSLFNIGDNTAFANPWPWMRVGMSCMYKYDGAYFGLKTEDDDRSDAVIAFGNDAAGPVGPDVLRFIFTRNQSEIARFAPNGGNGFGNFYTYGINTQPVRRLEILDADPTGFGNSNAPNYV